MRLSYTPYGEKTKTRPDIFHQKYTGQVDDGDESGLLYYKARYYDPLLGRFITADSIVPGADKTQAYNRYMYVKGNPVSFNDPNGHGWNKWVKRIAGAVIGGALGGVTGAAVGYAAVKYRNNIKNFISDHGKQILTTAAGYLIGGPIGAIYGYAAGSDGGMQQFWKDHQWFRITTYVLVTVAVVAVAAFAGPVLGAGITWALAGALIGGSIGFVYGGTNGFQSGWNWENAFKYMMKGAIYGAIIGYSFGNAYETYYLNESAMYGDGKFVFNESFNLLNTGPWAIAHICNTPILYQTGAILLTSYSIYSIYATPSMAEKAMNHKSFDIMGYGYDFDDQEVLY